MKRILIICNAYSQFINATHMKLTLFKNSDVSIILTDQTKGLECVANKVKRIENLFSEVIYVETSAYCSHKKGIGYFHDLWHVLIKDHKYSFMKDKIYDEIISYNSDFFLMVICDYLRKVNRKLIVSRFEESVLSYNHKFTHARMRTACVLRKCIGKIDPFEDASFFYCYYPELYKGKAKTIQIPRVEADFAKMAQIMSMCFDLHIDENCYKQKYIFFTSVYDFEGGKPIGEYEAVCKITDVVGKNNLLIKQHPRDERTIYRDNGYIVDTNSGIPWEVIQFQIDIKEKVLLTVNSSSVLSSALLFSKGAKSFFVFKLCDLEGNSLAKESIKAIEMLLNKQSKELRLENVYLLNDLNDLR